MLLSAANTHDSKLFEPLLETNPSVRGHRHHPGRPRRRPEKLHADKGHDNPRCRRYLCTVEGSKSAIARRGIEDKNKFGRHRWVVERTVSWLLRFGLRYDRTQLTLARYSPWAATDQPAPTCAARVLRPGSSTSPRPPLAPAAVALGLRRDGRR